MCAGHVIPHAIIIYQVTHHLMRIGHHACWNSDRTKDIPVESLEHDLAPWLQLKVFPLTQDYYVLIQYRRFESASRKVAAV